MPKESVAYLQCDGRRWKMSGAAGDTGWKDTRDEAIAAYEQLKSEQTEEEDAQI